MKITCDLCGVELEEPGALIFSPPANEDGKLSCDKFHCCRSCWPSVQNLFKKNTTFSASEETVQKIVIKKMEDLDIDHYGNELVMHISYSLCNKTEDVGRWIGANHIEKDAINQLSKRIDLEEFVAEVLDIDLKSGMWYLI